MYSEHLIASLLRLVRTTVGTGVELDRGLGRVAVTVGRVIGPDVGCRPNDAALARLARTTGTPAPVGTRGAVHVLEDGRCGLGLGSGRGVIETAGYRLVVLARPEPGRYAGAWRLPSVTYGGLI